MDYKNFMPKEYINKLKLRENNFLNILIVIFLIANLTLLPKSINKVYESKKVVEVISLNSETIDYSKKELLEVIDLLNFKLDYLEIKDGKGIIKLKDEEDIYLIDNYINIKSIDKAKDGYYSLGVEL